MMDQTVSKLLNEQINKEFYSAYLYLDIANFYDDKGLDGFANWYEIRPRKRWITPCSSIIICTTMMSRSLSWPLTNRTRPSLP